MRYFAFEEDESLAVQLWNESQFDLCDIVLFLVDNNIMIGAKIYAIFLRNEVKNILNHFVCDLKLIKEDLHIAEYVERKGDCFSKLFNPKRKILVNNISIEKLKKRAEKVYEQIIKDLGFIALRLQ